MEILLFEDRRVANLLPLVWTRPAYSLWSGGWSLLDLVRELDRPLCADVRPHLQELQRIEYGVSQRALADADGCLIVNARLQPTVELASALRQVVTAAEPTLVMDGEQIAYALGNAQRNPLTAAFPSSVVDCAQPDSALRWFEWPHDVVFANQSNLSDNLQERLRSGRYREVRDGVYAANGVQIADLIAVDSRKGPIVVDQGAEIGAFSHLVGPIYVGERAQVQPHACLMGPVSIGEQAKVGGEVEASVVSARSNKKHFGYLGHSYLGSWVNLGAGTVIGNLKHTYGEIRMRYPQRTVATGGQFLGALISDYSRTSIQTGIYPGKWIGVCSLLAGTVTENVFCFQDLGVGGGERRELPIESAIRMQGRMLARRGMPAQPYHAELLQYVFQQSGQDRRTGSM